MQASSFFPYLPLITLLQLEWLTAIPWPNSTYVPSTTSQPSSESSHAQSLTQPLHTKAFLTNARAQLDADHFGLEKIKKRLIEYLAVVRLKEMNAERELAAERQIQKEREAAQRTAKESEGKLDEGKKDIDTQPQAQLQQLQFGVPDATGPTTDG
jgi:ATP-dependent Lon protease